MNLHFNILLFSESQPQLSWQLFYFQGFDFYLKAG